ncbi:MAG: SRPBCC domain-containing protein [Drouetiella hepatica Uher 2000/2452]|jgi:hypothetical protein|uniref:SRPBCC domain-containing protein n=1 Tax=Drouetiella hepatica Uher 2000/2452 TaxID=904376 RepID=A0A951Q8P6_9CYAN|nr:SRPBCC domain-containing protein [Drouetiella hepatica Uher 2000/2452]
MPSLYAEIEISAPKSVIWQALVCKENWLKWNTFLYDRDPSKPFVEGQVVHLSLRRLQEESETEFEPRITLLQPEICLRWSYSAPGLRSQHVFELQEISKDRTQYLHQAYFSGIITRLFLPFLRQDEQQGMRRMARELKQHIEGYR